MNRTLATLTTVAVLLGATGAPFSTAEARDQNSDKQTHYYSPPILLLPYIEQHLRICVADAAKAAHRNITTYLKLQVKGGAIYNLAGDVLLEIEPGSSASNEGDACLDIATNELGPPGGAPPEAILAELNVSTPAESKSVPIVTFEHRDPGSNRSIALLLPAVQAEAPIAPGRFSNYRPQFYFRTTDVGTLTHIFGPFTLTAGQEVDICAKDVAALANEMFPLNFTEIVWRIEVHATARKGDTTLGEFDFVKEIDRSGPKANCTDAITLADILQDQDIDPGPVESLVMVILLYAEAPPGAQVVPMATGRLKPIIFDEPEPVPLLLPAVQAAREAAR